MMKKGILYKIRRKMQVAFFNVFSIEFVSKTYYKIVLKKKLNLDEPKTLNEKIQWLKIYHWPKNDLVIKCADKFAVREYVDSVGLSNVLNELYFVCDDP